MKTIKQWAVFLVWFVLVFGCLRAWKVDGSDAAGGLVQLVLWLGAAFGVCLGFTKPTQAISLPGEVLVMAKRSSMLVLILTLSWYGHFVLAFAQVLGGLCAAVHFGQYDADGKPLPPRAPSAAQES